MAADEKWYFTKEQLINTPSRKCGIDADKELSYRQQAANFIQDMGQRLQVSQLCINTAIVYMHRFYVFHSLTQFHRNSISAAAIFLAAKVEEQPRKLEHVIRMAFKCLNKGDIDVKSELYLEQVQDLVFNENVLLQTLGFDVAIDHPHTHVVRCCYLVKANKDLSQTSYFMASNSLHLTTMCLQYKPTVVACFCIHLACKWSHLEIPQSAEGKNWFWYVDKTVTSELLAQLTGEFLHIFDKCPSKLKRKIRSISANQSPSIHQSSPLLRSPFDSEPRRVMQSSPSIDSDLSFQSNRLMSFDKSEIDGSKKLSSAPSGRTVDLREYREKNRERQEREKAAVTNAALGSSQNVDPSKHHSDHHKQSSSGVPVPSKHSSSSSNAMKQTVHHNHHHHHHHSSRQDPKSSSQMMSQRHSTSNSSNSSSGSNSNSNSNRDPNRERQRMSREYSSSSNYSSHNHSLDNILDVSMSSIGADIQTVHPPEKLNNTLPKIHSDLRHSKQQKDLKPYPKFADPSRSRKPDILEQRSEEVRKLIEKPLPPPKPRVEVRNEKYAALIKQSHHPSKYGHQAEKPIPSANMSQASLPTLTGSDSKMLNVGQTAFTTEKSPNAPVSASQISQKSLSSSKTSQAKNGSLSTSATSSFSLVNNLDDVKIDKKPRISDQDNAVPTPPNKHRSLFSPEKTLTPTTTRESSHSQRLKQKQKTPPVMPKQDIHSSFLSPGTLQVTSDSMQQKQKSNNTSLPLVSSQKQHRLNTETSNNIDQDIKSQVDNSGRRLMGFNMPETVHNSSSTKNVTAAAALVDTKPKLEPFDGADSLTITSNQRSKPRSQQQNSSLTNGLHSSLVKQEFSLMDPSSFIVKPELPDQLLSNEIPSDLMYSRSEHKVMDFLSFPESVVKTERTTESDLSLKKDSFTLHKSPQSISALLQEPLAPMPSLLQVPNYDQQPAIIENKLSHQIQHQQMPPEPLLPSTVDMSELVAPIQCTVDIPAPVTTTASVPVSNTAVVTSASLASSEEKKSEHRSKSEKKKKEKKHKHKEKEKSKEKHKHKHKDKDKEKHHRDKSDREKDKTDEGSSASSSNPGTVPIKITIPKDKLNLSTESIGTSSSTPSSSLKIKIAKERLKGSEVCGQQLQQPLQQQMLQQPQQSVPQPQAPLKIKIRTNEISRSGELQAAVNQQPDGTSRKRDRSDGMDGSMVIGAPPTKKPQHQQQQPQQPQLQQQPQRPNERQNGRHSYSNSGSSNKVRGVGRGVGHPRPPPYPYPPQYALAQQHLRGEPGYRNYQQQRQSPPPPAFLRHPRPPPHHPYYNYSPAAAAPPVFAAVGYGPAGVFADPALYYQYQQQQQQQQYAMYTTAGLMMTVDGQIDTSVPPPSLASQGQALGQTASDASKFVGEQPAPPLPNGPPPSSSPPPPPPPE